jgi:hypothetical protein
VRQIAAEVFGDPALRGRVERILKARTREEPAAGGLESVDIAGLSSLEVLTMFFERRLALIAATGGAPSMAELRHLLDVQRQLEAWQTVERLNELTRRHQGGDD